MKRKWQQLPLGELVGPVGFSMPRPPLTNRHEPIRPAIVVPMDALLAVRCKPREVEPVLPESPWSSSRFPWMNLD